MGVDLNMRETRNFVGRNSLLSLSPLRNGQVIKNVIRHRIIDSNKY